MSNSILVNELDAASGKIGVLSLNMPKSLNSLTVEMIDILSQQIKAWEADEGIAVIILKAEGDRAFCAGANIQSLYQSAIETPGGPCEYAETFFLNEYALDYRIHNCSKPILALAHGIVMGGGLGLIAGASHRMVAPASRIAMPEITIGLFPDVGGTSFLGNIPYNLGYFLALTGAQINANDAIFMNLADSCIAFEDITAVHDSISKTEWTTDPSSNHELLDEIITEFALSSKALDQQIPSNIKPHLIQLESACQAHSLAEMIQEINQIESDDTWLEKARNTLKNGSPLSSLLIYEQIKRHKYDDLRNVFLSEYQLATNIIRYPEFAEGVRALLIDKDKDPKWMFEHFSAVPSSLINTMFSAPWESNPLEKLI